MDDILRMLDELQLIAVDDPRTIIGRLTYGLDKDEVQMQISKIKASLPTEIRNASHNVRESEKIRESAVTESVMTIETAKKEAERMIADAKVEADKVIELARVQQERLVADSEILKLSKAQAEEIRNSAERDAIQTRRGADQYAGDVLARVEANVEKALMHVKSSRAELSVTDAPVGQAVVRTGERIRV